MTKVKKIKTIILGAGVTGLYTAKCLLDNGEKSVTILEKQNHIGGLCSSFDVKISNQNFILDLGPHKLFSTMPGYMDEFKRINGKNNITIEKRNSLFFLDKKFQFPINPIEMIKNISPKTVSAGTTIPLSFIKSVFLYNLLGKKSNSFEDFLIKGFGKKAYNILFKGYAWKVWTNPKYLSKEIAEIRIPVPDVGNLVKNILSRKSDEKVSAKEFFYSKYGIRGFVQGIAKEVINKNGKIVKNQKITSIKKSKGKYIIKSNKKTFICENLISTIPLYELVKIFKDSNNEIKKCVNKLKYNDLSLIYLFFDKPKIITENWIFFPELEYSFNRISEQKGFSKYMIPKNKTVLCLEITNPKINGLNEHDIIEIAIKDLIKAKIISKTDANLIIKKHFIKLKGIYPIYDLDYKANLNQIINFIENKGIITLGRFGLFNYNNIDHCMDMGKLFAKHFLNKGSMNEWKKVKNKFNEYRIVD